MTDPRVRKVLSRLRASWSSLRSRLEPVARRWAARLERAIARAAGRLEPLLGGHPTPLWRSKLLRYAALGFLIGLGLTACGYVVDYVALYKTLPTRISLQLILGLHAVTPVHFFTDGFALILALVGGIAGRLQDRIIYYSSHLERLVAERTWELQRSEERYALAARGANDGLWDWDLRTDEMYYSARWKQSLGYREAEVGGSPEEWFGRVHAEDAGRLKTRLQSHLAGVSANFSAEYRMRCAGDTYRWMLARGMALRDPASGKPHRMAGSQTDIHERKQMEEQLMHLALHDPLTDLPNRTLFLDRLSQAFVRARRRASAQSLAIIFVDVDRFKNINDSVGHLEGDRILEQIAKRLRQCLEDAGEDAAPLRRSVRGSGREEYNWTLARMGGDEFTVLLEDVASTHQVTRLVRRITEAFHVPLTLGDRQVFITLSVGIVLGPSGYEQAEDLVRDADTAMYRAKDNGRARFEVFDKEMLAKVQERLRLETDLHLALEREEIRIVYQPIIDTSTGTIAGFEVLARWEHPERGTIPPADFIPLAEETGIILNLGPWILAEACRQMRRWQEEVPEYASVWLSVNVSPMQLYDRKFVSRIETIAAEAKLSPGRIHLEITETALINDIEQVGTVLGMLKERGFKVTIDDFGTGYSSLGLLQSLPVSALKIDRCFVERVGKDRTAKRIVSTIAELASCLGLDVIAEGVETAAQASELAKIGCDYVQGFRFSEPLEAGLMAAEVLKRFSLPALPRGRKSRRRSPIPCG